MKKEQRVMAWTALEYYIKYAEKNKNGALELGMTEDAKYWEEQHKKAVETQEAIMKERR